MSGANKLTSEILIEIPKRYGSDIRLWRNNRITAMALGRGGNLRRMSAGIDGQGDISGIIGPHGKRLEIEVKYGKDRQTIVQQSFQLMIEKYGGLYILARSLDDVVKALEGR